MERNQARITLLDVQPSSKSFLPFFRKSDEAVQQMIEARKKRLAECAEQLKDVATVEQKVLTGDRHVETIREVLRGGYDLVLKDARAGRISFGSTDQRLFRECPVPVWVLRDDEPEAYKRVFVAIDPMSEGSAPLVGDLLAIASSMAQREGAELDVVHVWRMPGEEMLRHGMIHTPEAEVNEALAEAEKEHKAAMEKVVAPIREVAPSVQIHLLKSDDPGQTIAKLSKDRDASVIVMGTVGRRGIAGWIIGNTAETILQEVDCSVFAIKPADFDCPVSL